ncbi:MAG: exlusion protein FxsA [Candidatus Parabeggiatoa sp. nov. 1]|nr:MAG: exlusion protein FxsA [Gammaproteobacteria bacterium]
MSSFRSLLLLFIIVPILEIYLLITVGSFIGVLPTVLLVILTAILGTYLLRIQGLATMQKMQNTLQQGQLPAEALFEGILLLLGGALLLTPGFFTDTVGFMCLIPSVRQYLVHWLHQRLQVVGTSAPPEHPKRPSTIEGEYRREDK